MIELIGLNEGASITELLVLLGAIGALVLLVKKMFLGGGWPGGGSGGGLCGTDGGGGGGDGDGDGGGGCGGYVVSR